ncbi:hypothetical protein H311_01482, partial [Anncaliia algerae PRA109]
MSVNYKLIKSSNAKQLLKDQMSFSVVLESEELKGDLDFEISYSVDPHTEKFDQTISKLSVGPIPKGNIGFNIETNPVKIELLKPEYIFGITSVIIVGKYKSNPFMRVGYILEVTYPNIDNKYLIKEDEIGEELDSEENTLEKSYECECEEDNCLCEDEEDYEEENCECEGECECAEEYICECGNEECDCNECNCEGECDCMNEYVCECGNEDCNCNECNCEGECNCEENHECEDENCECEDEKLCEEEDCNNILKEPLNKNEDCENREEIPKFNEKEMMEGSKKEADASKDNCENKEIIELVTNKQTEKINTEKGNECNQENLIKEI